ncbi:hypothetical protein [Bifidobacterium indicum]|uniref:hypothetical protein n=1 Tax=Bifidobacterium indicum TaxID=1691 RepID=UPI0030DCD700
MSEWHGADIHFGRDAVSINGVDLSNCVEDGSVKILPPVNGMPIPRLQLTILADKITLERSDSGR